MPKNIFFWGFAFLSGLYFSSTSLFGYPENIRYKYGNCGTCNVSPTGGGLVTGYGRELSKEILSSYVEDKKSEISAPKQSSVSTPPKKPLLPSWLKLGGHTRTLQTYQNTTTRQSGRLFLMHADAEALIHTPSRNHMLLGTLGVQQERTAASEPSKYKYMSRRHFYLTQPIQDLWLRMGKFQFAYGINTPEHMSSVKRGLGLGENTETYNVETALIKERLNVIATAILGRIDDPKLDLDRGYSLNISYFIKSGQKIGLSYLQANRDSVKRNLYGGWVLASFTKRLFGLAEYDLAQLTPTSGSGTAITKAFYTKLGFEASKGVNFLLTYDSLKKPESIRSARGYGIQYFPYPLVEVGAQLEISQTKVTATGESSYEDFAWLLLHLYL